MKLLTLLSLALIFSVTTETFTQSRCRRHRCDSHIVAGFLGGLTGATLAAASFGDQWYYQDGAAYEYVYPGAPLYAYDYPTYVYSPVYAYSDMRYTTYPSYYLRR